MKFILGTKIKMTQVFDETGQVHPATIIKNEPTVVTQVKTLDKDGYNAVQVGYGKQKESRLSKAVRGHMKASGGMFQRTREFRVSEDVLKTLKPGDPITVDVFAPGDIVCVSGLSKGKGFQGVVKRHGFGGGRRTHGQKHSEREPGSIGATGPQRVFNGTRMAGRMGGNRVTVSGLKILSVDKGDNTIVLSGAVPGRRGTVLELRIRN